VSKTQILIAGHGGQGILLLGDYIAYTALRDGKNVAYTPSYGPETRGGKAKCYVIVSDEEVDNPIAEEPDVELIMNLPSMDFLAGLRPGGLLVYNSSLANEGVDREDIRVIGVPATEIAEQLRTEPPAEGYGDTKMFANTVMFGVFLEACAPLTAEAAIEATLQHFIASKGGQLMELNRLALRRGRDFAVKNPPVRKTWQFSRVPSWAAQ
jgi:2-oxoglutarate ferredoxin oxidoreductase subunit gamma